MLVQKQNEGALSSATHEIQVQHPAIPTNLQPIEHIAEFLQPGPISHIPACNKDKNILKPATGVEVWVLRFFWYWSET